MNRSQVTLFLVLGPPVLLIAAVLVQPWADPRWAFPDPVVAAQSADRCCSAYFGFISNLGIVYWCAAATACACAALVLHAAGAPVRQVAFLASAAALSAILGLDDLLLLHERILPRLGLPQDQVLAAYALAAIAYVSLFFRDLLQRDFAVLAAGALGLGLSLIVDVVVHHQTDAMRMLEDSAKFIGIAGWSGYHVLRAVAAMRALVVDRRPVAAREASTTRRSGYDKTALPFS